MSANFFYVVVGIRLPKTFVYLYSFLNNNVVCEKVLNHLSKKTGKEISKDKMLDIIEKFKCDIDDETKSLVYEFNSFLDLILLNDYGFDEFEMFDDMFEDPSAKDYIVGREVKCISLDEKPLYSELSTSITTIVETKTELEKRLREIGLTQEVQLYYVKYRL
jgi:hypothetical protein